MYSDREIMQFMTENDVKFIRLFFCDGKGRLKNISVMPYGLERALSAGQEFDAEPIFGAGAGRLKLQIDVSTLMAMPWRPSQGRVVRFFCDIKKADGSPFEQDYRYKLRQALPPPDTDEVVCVFPFMLHRSNDNGSVGAPWDEGGYFDVSPEDKGENMRRELCLSLDEMKIPVLASYHGDAAGKNVIEFGARGLAAAADYIAAFRAAALAIATRNGLHAVFANDAFVKLTVPKTAKVFNLAPQANPYRELINLLNI